MRFELDQRCSHLEFKERMEGALKEAKAALAKSKDDMAKYYNQTRTVAPEYQPADKVYLDASNIQTTRPVRGPNGSFGNQTGRTINSSTTTEDKRRGSKTTRV